MMRPRWIKLWRDAQAERGRFALMLLAMVVALAALGAVLGAYAVLTRDMARNYLGTDPAHATLEMRGDITPAMLAAARSHSTVAVAEARDVLLARARVGDEWRPVLLFAVDDFKAIGVSRFLPHQGRAEPEAGSVLVEHTATGVLGTQVGSRLVLKSMHGAPHSVPVSGLVHDPGLAPAWQERSGYVYLDRAMLRQLGEDGSLHELRVRFRDTPQTLASVQAAAESLTKALQQQGYAVLEIRVPPPLQHPHQRQMTTVLLLLLAFSVMTLVLSAVLVANTLAALLARQVREMGVMKALGASTPQLVRLYLVLVTLLGGAALAVALPLGLIGTRVFSGAVATLLNLTLTQATPPWWVLALQSAAALTVPLLVAAGPVWSACRVTVREALNRHGAGGERLRQRIRRWPMAFRNVLRKPVRLSLTLGLLAVAGAMYMSALNVSGSWQRTIDKVYETRHYDVEVRFHEPQSEHWRARLLTLAGVGQVEAWGYSTAAFAQPGRVDVSRAYPDRGHGAMAVMAPPANTRMVSFPLRAGRWLQADDHDAVVLNHAAAAQQPHLKLGDRVLLSWAGQAREWRLVGIVEEIGAAGVAYVSDQAFARSTGQGSGVRMLRLATDATTPEQRAQRIRQIEAALIDGGAAVESVQPLSELRNAMGEHIVILIRALLALALVMAAVGGLGLASTLGINVLERTRELAVMKTLGATRGRLLGTILGEAQIVSALSVAGALLLALPLTWLLDVMIGRLGFVAPLPFVVSPWAVLSWLLGVLLLSALAAWLPARRAAGLPISLALAEV